MKDKYKCELCGRDKFDTDRQPHICNKNFRKKLPKFTKVLQNFAIAGVLISVPLYPASIQTPENLGEWLLHDFTYQKDYVGSERKDNWKTPEETVKDKNGDCEDFAILAKKVLEDMGYKPDLIIMSGRDGKPGHAICLFKEKDGTYSVFDNTRYRRLRYYRWKYLMNRYYSRFKNVYNCVDKNKCQKIYTIKEKTS